MNQEDSEQNEVDGVKKGVDSTGKVMHNGKMTLVVYNQTLPSPVHTPQYCCRSDETVTNQETKVRKFTKAAHRSCRGR